MLVEVPHPSEEGTYTALGMPVTFSNMGCYVRRRPPVLGEHTREVLLGLGYQDDAIDTLYSSHVVA